MESLRFDTIARLFSARRLSRRTVLASGGAGLAAVALGSNASAQDATPSAAAATPVAESDKTTFLFVQTFGAGAISSGDDGQLTLTADHLTGQTIYFSDRPERIVGTVSTARFLGLERNATATPEAGLGFTPADPPNAALVFDSAAGEEAPGDVLIVELIDPTYDPATGQATYALKVLADETAVDLTLVSEPVAAADAIRQFEGASLFIDGCPDGTLWCRLPDANGDGHNTIIGTSAVGYCYDWSNACCMPCALDFSVECATLYPSDCYQPLDGAYLCEGYTTGGQFACDAVCC